MLISAGPLLLLSVWLVNWSQAQIIYTSQPRIQTQDGNLILLSAENRNISLKTLGSQSFINFNGENLIMLVHMAKNATSLIEGLRTGELATLQQTMESVTSSIEGSRGIKQRLLALENNIANGTVNWSRMRTTNSRRFMAISRRLTKVERFVRRIRVNLAKNECETTPCQNGGTCEDSYNKFICRCPSNWEGETCSVDVNECARFAGTDLGCQNGATCVNRQGSYDCLCANGYFGLHCTRSNNDCSSGSAQELCGHGICISQRIGGRGYTCLCDQGWSSDPASGACTRDVDECASATTPPCSRSPPVQCINTQGSFFCAACPHGYTGNGYYCNDLDECLNNNGGCSLSPMVQCINTQGSRVCGACPPGYQGDGTSCSLRSMCQVDNGGCHPLARCYDNPNIGQAYVQCTCPPGYVGSGIGQGGCMPGGAGTNTSVAVPSVCSPNPCVHGTCTQLGATFVCSCVQGFMGSLCQVRVNPCSPNPCLNGATCLEQSGSFTCLCTNEFRGQRCESQTSECTGQLRQDSGELRYPSSGSTHGRQANCYWQIAVNASKIINMTFTSFSLPNPTNCLNNWLQIHDGPQVHSPLVGTYCGSTRPPSVLTTDNYLTLWYRVDKGESNSGFALRWNSTDPMCGSYLDEAPHGNIKSPGAPGKYPKNRDCLWILQVTPGRRINIHIFTLMLETHDNCSFDFLKVYDGSRRTDPLLRQFCNTSQPPPFISSSHEVLVHFHSDNISSDYGFQLTYAAVAGVPGCGGVWTAQKGEFTTPNYPRGYPGNLLCEYLIQLPMNERIKLTFASFQLENADNCIFDYVEIREGTSERDPLVGKYCGEDKPAPYVSQGHELLIVFHSDGSVPANGFRILYETACGGIFTADTGRVQSPNYPNQYPKNVECIYEISLPVGKAIKLQFEDFNMEVHDNCAYDALEIRDGDNANARLFGKYCGQLSSLPPVIVSTYNQLWLKFSTDISVAHTGFLANYTSINVKCGGILKNSSGEIKSPSNMVMMDTCTWIISAPAGFVIRLTWRSFSLVTYSSDTECIFDVVQVFDNSSTSETGSLMGRFCQSRLPPTLTTFGNLMTISFQQFLPSSSFEASYTTISSSQLCGGNYFVTNGVVKSPLHPSNYPNNLDCVWTIEVPAGQQIRLNATTFLIESSQGCSFDYLEIRNGGTNTSPLIGKFCGNTIPKIIPSFSNSLYLHFHTDDSVSVQGFSIDWDGTATGCGGTLTGYSGTIHSPNYPSNYLANTECFWKIAVNRGSAIRLIIMDMDLETGPGNCVYDFLEVRDGKTSASALLGRFCHHENAPILVSTQNYMWLLFRADASLQGRGFSVRYETVCNHKLTGYRGVIESPNFPNPYPHNRNCTWIISAPPGNKINITFSHFELEFGHVGNCSYDFVMIKEGKDEQPAMNSLGTFCGDTRPEQVITSSLNTLYVTFQTDSSVPANGFRLEWIIHGCGGIFDAPFGTLKTPNYPMTYPKNTVCVWTINVDWDQSVELTIHDLNMEHSQDCVYDYLKVWGGPDKTSPMLANLCTTLSYKKLTSSGRTMRVEFHSDQTFAGKGFSGSYRNVPSLCGGKMSTNTGTIHSKNYPQNYEANDDCAWQIEVDKNFVISLMFYDFDIYDHDDNCSLAYVRVFDGPNENSPMIMNLCGNENRMPKYINSTSNQLYIRMKAGGNLSDTASTSKGFIANYTLKCGARIVTNGSGEIYSVDNINFESSETSNCTWIIISDQPEGHVTLALTHLDISANSDNSGDCNFNYVVVRDGEGLSAPIIGKYCGSRIPPHVTSQGSALTFTIVAFSGMFHGTLAATYSVINGACGGRLTSEEGSFANPGYPQSYPVNAECIWTINTSPGNKAIMTFGMFDIEPSDDCNGDYLEIRAGVTGSDPLLGVFCGNNVPSNLTASTKLWVKFHSDAEGVAPGFIAHYSLVHGGELSGPRGLLTNPLHPKTYIHPGEFWWRISVAFGSAIRITFKELYLDTIQCHSSLTIYDGFDDTAQTLYTACEIHTLPDALESTNNVVYIKFSNNPLRFGSTFMLEWLQIQRSIARPLVSPTSSPIPGCGGIYSNFTTNTSVDFHSPGYPRGYAHNLNCEWIFEAPPTYHMAMIFNTMNLEPSIDCMFDYISVYSGVKGTEQWSLIGKYCHSNATQMPGIHASEILKAVFHTDVVNNRTGFAATAVAVCGNSLQGPNGVIQVFNLTQPAPMFSFYQACEYNITVRAGRRIKVIFEEIHMPNEDPACSDVYIMLKNGRGSDSPLLGDGKYCGNTNPTIPETTGNKLYIKYSGTRGGAYGFRLWYEEVSSSCGGQFFLSDETPFKVISSPNHPRVPPLNTECEWVFVGPQGQRLRMDFKDRIDFSYSRNCERAYIEVNDGGSALAPQLAKLCRESPSSLWSTDNALYIHYFTDVTDPKPGFNANISVAKCGGTIRGEEGTITAPDIPDSAPLVCTWKIVAPASNLLTFTFESLDLPTTRGNCSNDDYISITENVDISNNATELGRFCGNTKPTADLEAGTDNVHLVFKSSRGSGRVTGRTFKIRFTSVLQRCGGNLDTPEGEITSPEVFTQRRRRVCTWMITVPKGRRIRLEFLDFDLEGARPVCPQWLGVYNGVHNLQIGIYCGSDRPAVIESSTNKMTLHSLSWHSSGHRGFKLRYTSDQPSVCDGNLDGDSGTLQFPSTNLSSVFCEWERTDAPTARNNTFAITIFNATVNASPDVQCYRSPRSLLIGTGTMSLGYFCGNYTTPQIISNPFGRTTIRASQGDLINRVQFNIRYKSHNCGGILIGPNEEITSPNYPQEYNASTDCAWSLQFPVGQSILLKFVSMDLEPECDHDYVTIYNGMTSQAPYIGTYCGNSLPGNIQSQSNHMFVVFHSDAQHQRGGFKLTAEPVTSGCGGIYHRSSGQISSPNFPNHYPNNAECEWEIRVDSGYHIGLQFIQRFHLESSTDCANDFVEVFNFVNQAWVSLGKLCGRDMPSSFNSTGNIMKILFRTNPTGDGDGFKAVWSVNCGGIITDTKGEIISPSYPDNYGKRLLCNYTISAPGKVISYEFVDFSLEQGFQDCRYDNVTLYRNLGSGRQSRLLPSSMSFSSTHCGQEPPPPGWSPNSLSLVFQTDRWIEKRGFRMRYQLETCGGEVNESTIISNPQNMFIQGQNPKVNCTWVITAPTNKVVLIRFEQFVIEGSFNCYFAFVESFEGKVVNASKSYGRLCGNLTDRVQVLKSRSQQLVLSFFTEGMFRQNSRFSAAVSFTYGESAGCGGNINASAPGRHALRSFSVRPNARYEPMLDCHWSVQAVPGQIVRLTIEAMNIADCNTTVNQSEPCSCDYLEVFDGRGQFAEKIGRFCGTNLPPPLISSNKDMWVRFVSDDTYNQVGFEATVTAIPSPCGATLLNVTNTTQVLTSPSYPANYPSNIRCSWRLRSSQLMRFDIHILDVDMESSQGCANDNLELVDSAYSENFNEGFGETFIYSGAPKSPGGYMFQYSPARMATHKATFCGVGKSMDYVSLTNNVDISFVSNSAVSGKGFKIEYSFVGCSRNFTRRQGRIVDTWEQRNTDCVITIVTEVNRTIALYFTEMFMMSSDNCTSTGMEIKDGATARAPLLAKVCGFQVPNPIFSTGSAIYMRTWSHSNWYKEHYDVTYTTTDQGRGCGGQIFNVAGTISSPLYPSNLRNFTQCRWDITVPEGSLVHIQFIVFNIGPSSTCDTDYIKLFDIDTLNRNEQLRTRLCGEDVPALFVSTSNAIALKYVTSVHNAGTGWNLNFAAAKKDGIRPLPLALRRLPRRQWRNTTRRG